MTQKRRSKQVIEKRRQALKKATYILLFVSIFTMFVIVGSMEAGREINIITILVSVVSTILLLINLKICELAKIEL